MMDAQPPTIQEPGIAIQIPFERECHYCGGLMRPTSESVWKMLVYDTPFEDADPGERLIHWPDMHVVCIDDEGEELDTRASGPPPDPYDDWEIPGYSGNPYGYMGYT